MAQWGKLATGVGMLSFGAAMKYAETKGIPLTDGHIEFLVGHLADKVIHFADGGPMMGGANSDYAMYQKAIVGSNLIASATAMTGAVFTALGLRRRAASYAVQQERIEPVLTIPGEDNHPNYSHTM